MAGAGQRRRQVEAEAVDVHLGDPVAQRVEDQPQRRRVGRVDGVAAARDVEVRRAVVHPVDVLVVADVVEAAEAQRRPERAALGGVVVDHVEDHLEARAVQRLDHRLELVDLLAAVPGRAVAVVRREEADRVVAPVVRHAGARDVRLRGELVHRQQLDRRDAEVLEVVHRGVRGQPRVAAADLLGHLVVQLGEALDVRLVDHCVGPSVARPHLLVVAPVEGVAHDDALRDERRGVAVVAGSDVRAAHRVEVVGPGVRVAVDRPRGVVAATDRAGVGVEQQLGRVEHPPAMWVPRAVGAEAVALSRGDAGHGTVPDAQGLLGEGEPGLCVVLVEEAQLHRGRLRREHREVRALLAPRRAQRLVAPGPDGRGHADIVPSRPPLRNGGTALGQEN